jgi:hypothetical protein
MFCLVAPGETGAVKQVSVCYQYSRIFAQGCCGPTVKRNVLLRIDFKVWRSLLEKVAFGPPSPDMHAVKEDFMALPLTKTQALEAAKWVKTNFGHAISQAIHGTPFSLDLVCGIVCQETAYVWLHFLETLSVNDVLARCVFDASGDFTGTRRTAFPSNTAAFRARYGDEFTQMLIDEANKTRNLRGFGNKDWVYKGCGLYQYDLQNVQDDDGFFRQKQWYSHDECLNRLMKELKEKYQAQQDLWKAIRAYNGSGSAATDYANNVIQFAQYSSEVNV